MAPDCGFIKDEKGIMKIEDMLAINKYDIDREVHINVNKDICQSCERHPCLYACPAGCYSLMEGHITFSYEGCLECGSCFIACDKGAVELNLPRGGLGICYQYG